MSNELVPSIDASTPITYQIRVKGHIGSNWTEWFCSLTITAETDGNTLITGEVDQAALYGLLKKVRDLGLTLISVNPIIWSDKE